MPTISSCMDRFWQWAWDRYGARYRWAFYAVTFSVGLQIHLFLTVAIVAFERSSRYVEVTVVTAGAVLVLEYVIALERPRIVAPRGAVGGWPRDRSKRCPHGHLHLCPQNVCANGVGHGPRGRGVVGHRRCDNRSSGAAANRVRILGALYGAGADLIGFRNILEAWLRPARAALAGETGIGDSLPRSCSTFAARSNVSLVAVAFVFASAGALLAAVIDPSGRLPYSQS